MAITLITDTIRRPFDVAYEVATSLGLGVRAPLRSRALASTRRDALPHAPGDALPIVLLHGLSGTQQHWDPAVEPLRAHGDVITIDLPGFGASPQPSTWTLDGAADAVLNRLADLGVERCILVGHSLGASLAVTLAARSPHLVAGLGLISPAGFWNVGTV